MNEEHLLIVFEFQSELVVFDRGFEVHVDRPRKLLSAEGQHRFARIPDFCVIDLQPAAVGLQQASVLVLLPVLARLPLAIREGGLELELEHERPSSVPRARDLRRSKGEGV